MSATESAVPLPADPPPAQAEPEPAQATGIATKRAPARRSWTPRILAATSAAVIVGLVLLLWFGIGQRERGGVGESSVPFRQAPDFELGLFAGGTFRLSDEIVQGKPVLVNFWASWCIPCREEAPVLQKTWLQYRDRVTVVGVDVQDTDADALKFIKEFGITYPNGAGNSGPISIAYGMRGVPESYFIAPDGRVLRKWNGALSSGVVDQYLGEVLAADGERR